MNNTENTSLYNCWQNLFLLILKKKEETINQENDKNVNKTEQIMVLGVKSIPEINNSATREPVDRRFYHTNAFTNDCTETVHLKSGEQEVLHTNSIKKADKLRNLTNDYAAYSNQKVCKSRNIKSDIFNKGDFRKHFVYPKVYALYKTVSGLKIGLNEKCKKSYKLHDSCTSKCFCSHCGTVDLVTDSLKHPLRPDYTISSNNVRGEKTNNRRIQRINSVSKHPSFVNLIRKVKAMEKRIAQLEHDAETHKFNMNVECNVKDEKFTTKTKDSILYRDSYINTSNDRNNLKNVTTRFPIAIHKLRSEKYRQKKELESLNVDPQPMSEKPVCEGTENTINKSKRKFHCTHSFDENKSEQLTHSIVHNDMMNKQSLANTITIRITDKTNYEPEKIKTIFPNEKNTLPIKECKSKLENRNDKHSKCDMEEEECKFKKNSIVSIISDSKSCWSSFKSMFSYTNKITKDIQSIRIVPEINKSEKHISDDLTSLTNSDRYSEHNPSDTNTTCNNVNTNDVHLENAKCLNLEVEANSSQLQNEKAVKKDKTQSYTNINYKELLKSTVKHPSKLNNMLTLSFEEKSHLLREQCQHLEEINKKIKMIQCHYGKI